MTTRAQVSLLNRCNVRSQLISHWGWTPVIIFFSFSFIQFKAFSALSTALCTINNAPPLSKK